MIDGDSFHECLANGTWSGRMPTCQSRDRSFRIEISFSVLLLGISCPVLKPNSRVVHACSPAPIEKNQFEVGTECVAKCNQTGYRLVGPRTRKCLPFGKWTGYDQSCIGKSFASARHTSIASPCLSVAVGEETTPIALVVPSTSTRPTTTHAEISR